MKVYGSDICIDCRNYKAIQKNRGFEAEYIDITENTQNLREFLHFRDNEPIFEQVRQRGGIGIPLFVREDGVKTFEIDEALSWLGQPPVDFPQETAIGALGLYVCNGSNTSFQPMNINFGIIPSLGYKVKGKRNKNAELSRRSLEIIDRLKEEVLP